MPTPNIFVWQHPYLFRATSQVGGQRLFSLCRATWDVEQSIRDVAQEKNLSEMCPET